MGEMLKRIILISLTAVYLMGSSVSFLPHICYLVNKDYIAANFCENKSTPAMHCDGKCFLKKEIIKLTEQSHGQDKNNQQQQQNEMNPHIAVNGVDFNYFETGITLESISFNSTYHSFINNTPTRPPEILG